MFGIVVIGFVNAKRNDANMSTMPNSSVSVSYKAYENTLSS